MFVFGKLVHFLIHPWHAVLVVVGLGLALRALGLKRTGAGAFWAAGAAVVIISATPLADTLAYGLENRIDAGAYDIDTVAGAIVLGGATDFGELAEAHETYVINDSAERLTTILSLRRRRPDLPILISGGSGRLFDYAVREADVTRMFLTEVGVDPDSVMFEDRSRNTYENAAYTAEMLEDRPGPYLLVTSSWHMPRALGCFRKVGVDVIPYPVDYRARPPSWALNRIDAQERFNRLDRVLYEAVGLITYRLVGRTDALLPNDAPPR